MTIERFRSSRPDAWVRPRPWQDASARFAKHGPIRPMDEPERINWLQWSAIVFAIAAVLVGATGDIWL